MASKKPDSALIKKKPKAPLKVCVQCGTFGKPYEVSECVDCKVLVCNRCSGDLGKKCRKCFDGGKTICSSCEQFSSASYKHFKVKIWCSVKGCGNGICSTECLDHQTTAKAGKRDEATGNYICAVHLEKCDLCTRTLNAAFRDWNTKVCDICKKNTCGFCAEWCHQRSCTVCKMCEKICMFCKEKPGKIQCTPKEVTKFPCGKYACSKECILQHGGLVQESITGELDFRCLAHQCKDGKIKVFQGLPFITEECNSCKKSFPAKKTKICEKCNKSVCTRCFSSTKVCLACDGNQRKRARLEEIFKPLEREFKDQADTLEKAAELKKLFMKQYP